MYRRAIRLVTAAVAWIVLAVSFPIPSLAEDGSVDPGKAGEVEQARRAEGAPEQAANADAEEIVPLGEMVVTATRHEMPAFEIALPYNLLNEKGVFERVPMSMADLLEGLPGVDVSTMGRGSDKPVIRGLMDERVLILLDGVRLSEQRPGGNHILSLDPAQIVGMEIVRGPTSVLYGSDAIGGVMNVFTRRVGEDTGPWPRFSFEQGFEFESATRGWSTMSHVTAGRGRANVFAGGVYRDTQNLQTARGELPHSSYKGGTVWAGGNYIGRNWKVLLNYWEMNADIGIPAPSVFLEDCFRDEKHRMAILTFQRSDIGRFVDDFHVDFAYQRHDRHRYRLRTSPNPAVILGDLEVKIDLYIDTWILVPYWTMHCGNAHTITAGFQGFYEDATSGRTIRDTGSTWVNPAFHGVPVIPDSTRLGLGVFVQDEIDLSRRWELTLGVRYDWIRAESDGAPGHQVSSPVSATDGAVSGNIGVLFRANDQVNLYGNVGRAFRAPTLLERFFDGPHDIGSDIGNPDLDPETSLNFDLGVRVQYANWSGTVSAFYNRIFEYITKVPIAFTDDYAWENYADVHLYGLEAGGEYQIRDWVSVFGTLACVRGENLDTDEDLPSIPPLKGRYGIRLGRPVDGHSRLWAEISGLSVARQDHVAFGERETAGWTTFDVRVGIDVDDSLSVVLSAENLLNKHHHDHLSRAWQIFGLDDQAGRNLKLGIQVRF